MDIWKTYKNGNYVVHINTTTGTKVRETEEEQFIPSFAENVDVLTSLCCDHGCPWCYAGCTIDGKHGELLDWNFLNTLHPYTEMALNLNFPVPGDFLPLLYKLKEKKIITNITINQDHFMKSASMIEDLIQKKLIYGVGISLTKVNDKFIEAVKKFPTAVIHTINGVTSPTHFLKLADNDLKILILGYKDIGRGMSYAPLNVQQLKSFQEWTYDNIEWITGHFKVVSFDNLALEQLDVKRILSDEEWEEFYMGDDGGYTFFINLVDGTFGKNSLSTERFPIGDLSIDEMFKFIQRNK